MKKNMNKIFLNSQDIISKSDVYSYKRRNQQHREVDLISDEICVGILKNIKKEDRHSFLITDGERITSHSQKGLVLILFQRIKELQEQLENLTKMISTKTFNIVSPKKKVMTRKHSTHLKAGSFERVNEISKDVRNLKFRIGLLEKDMDEIYHHFKNLDKKKREIKEEEEEEPSIIID